jgi:hypothetical protein
MRNFVILALGLLLFGALGISQKQLWEAWKNHDIAP